MKVNKMNCAYHTENISAVNCTECGKPLCPYCDHRIKGFPYCQDCIVTGVELLRVQSRSMRVPVVKKQNLPLLALILSLFCPGLGAAYNGQTAKAIIHFLVFVGLFQLAILSNGMAVFVLGFIGMWFYTALDSWRIAQMSQPGILFDTAEDILVKRPQDNFKIWGTVLTGGIALIVIGILLILQILFDFNRLLIKFILPTLFIGSGLYLLCSYVSKYKNRKPDIQKFSRHRKTSDYSNLIADSDLKADVPDLSNDFSKRTGEKKRENKY